MEYLRGKFRMAPWSLRNIRLLAYNNIFLITANLKKKMLEIFYMFYGRH